MDPNFVKLFRMSQLTIEYLLVGEVPLANCILLSTTLSQ